MMTALSCCGPWAKLSGPWASYSAMWLTPIFFGLGYLASTPLWSPSGRRCFWATLSLARWSASLVRHCSASAGYRPGNGQLFKPCSLACGSGRSGIVLAGIWHTGACQIDVDISNFLSSVLAARSPPPADMLGTGNIRPIVRDHNGSSWQPRNDRAGRRIWLRGLRFADQVLKSVCHTVFPLCTAAVLPWGRITIFWERPDLLTYLAQPIIVSFGHHTYAVSERFKNRPEYCFNPPLGAVKPLPIVICKGKPLMSTNHHIPRPRKH